MDEMYKLFDHLSCAKQNQVLLHDKEIKQGRQF